MASPKLSKAEKKWLPWVQRNLVCDQSKAWRFYKEDICGIRPDDIDLPLSKRRANLAVIVGMVQGDAEDMKFKTLKKTIMKTFGLKQGQGQAVRDGPKSNTCFRGIRLVDKTGYEYIDEMWPGSTSAFNVWARGKWRGDCLDDASVLRQEWDASSPIKIREMEEHRTQEQARAADTAEADAEMIPGASTTVNSAARDDNARLAARLSRQCNACHAKTRERQEAEVEQRNSAVSWVHRQQLRNEANATVEAGLVSGGAEAAAGAKARVLAEAKGAVAAALEKTARLLQDARQVAPVVVGAWASVASANKEEATSASVGGLEYEARRGLARRALGITRRPSGAEIANAVDATAWVGVGSLQSMTATQAVECAVEWALW